MDEDISFYEKSADVYTLQDRFKYVEYYRAIEMFAEDREMIACYDTANKLLFNKRLPLSNLFFYEFFGTLKNAQDIADELAKIKNILGYAISVTGAYYQHVIKVNMRPLVIIYELPKIRGRSVFNIIMPSERVSIFGSNLLCAGAELQLLSTCAILTNPVHADKWSLAIDEFKKLTDCLFSELNDKLRHLIAGEGPKVIPVVDKLRKKIIEYTHEKEGIFIQTPPMRLQIILDMPFDQIKKDLAKISSDIKIEFTTDYLHVPTDRNFHKLTAHAILSEHMRVPLVDIFNLATYELVPYTDNHRATIYLKLRCKLVDLWSILTLIRSNAIKKDRGEILMFDIADKLRNIMKNYNKTPPSKLLPLRSYIGINADKSANLTFTPPYYPRKK